MKGFTIKGQHDRAQRRQLVIQLTRLAAVEKTSEEDTEFFSMYRR